MNFIYSETSRLVSTGLAAVGMEMWIFIGVALLVLFGAKKIPELARGVGKSVGELQKGLEEGKRGLNQTTTTHEFVAPTEEPAAPMIAAKTPAESQPRVDPPKSPTG